MLNHSVFSVNANILLETFEDASLGPEGTGGKMEKCLSKNKTINYDL